MNQIEKNATPAEPIRNPAKAIRAFCLECVGNSPQEVRLCPAVGCPLYHWRFGKKPDCFKREISDEERATMRERFVSRMGIGKNSEINDSDTNGEGN